MEPASNCLPRVVLGCLMLVGFASPVSSAAEFRPEDSIEIVKPLGGATWGDENLAAVPGGSLQIDLSPNGRWVVWVTVRGDLASDRNIYTMVRLDAQEIKAYVNGSLTAPKPAQKILLEWSSDSSSDAIGQLRWLDDSKRIVFLGTNLDADAHDQLFEIDVLTGKWRQVTHSPYSLRSYDLNERAREIVYTAWVPPDWSARSREGFVVADGMSLADTIATDPKRMPELRYFVMDTRTGKSIQLPLTEATGFPFPVSIQPDGNFAIAVSTPSRIPRYWARYEAVATWNWSDHGAQLASAAGSAPPLWEESTFGAKNVHAQQYMLLDLRKHTVSPLIDSPIGRAARRVVWAADGKSVAVSAVYYSPNADSNAAAPDIVRETKEVSVDLRDGHITAAASLPSTTSESGAARPLAIRVTGDAFTPYEYEARDDGSGKRRVLSQLNPQLARFELGELQEFKWTDRLGREWTGGLLLPRKEATAGRPPLVIQANGDLHSGSGFELPGLTSHPGRLFVSRGIAVLQLGCRGGDPASLQKYERNPSFGTQQSVMVCYEGAVDALDHAGIVDTQRLGIVGFSHTGNDVVHALTFSRVHFRAAAVIDSVQSTLWSYLMTYGLPQPGMMSWDANDVMLGYLPSYIGAEFYGDGISKWIERSPSFHADKIRTAILFESHGTKVPCPCWETFAVLRRHHMPAELAQYPNGDHDLKMPLERFTSRERILDWFDFWLRGVTRDDESKSNQYTRWRGMLEEAHTYRALPAEAP